MDKNMPCLDGPETSILIREFLQSKGINSIITAVTGHSEQKNIDISI